MRHLLEFVSAALFALSGAWMILLGLSRWLRVSEPLPGPASRRGAVFVFEGGQLAEACPGARRLLRDCRSQGSDLATLAALLSRGFGADLLERIAALPQVGRLCLDTDKGRLEAEKNGGALRVTLRLDGEESSALDRLSLETLQEELALLRGIADDAPQPIWALDASGALSWANRAYLDLADAMQGHGQTEAARSTPLRTAWPATPVFEAPHGLAEGRIHRQRVPLAVASRDEPLWFDVTSLGRETGSLNFAADVGSLVQAESARLHFVQALAKTFAHLATGLAIFDRKRGLVLFNPAFVDLTGLPVDFLSSGPTVQAVMDRLREAKILPEPRNYVSWREEVAALEAAAARGAYADTWTLPSGRTFRVTGRPHPEGALAFLFEDITNELGLTRCFRDELAALRAAFDGVSEAVAVFGPGGALSFCNAAYAALWDNPAPQPGDGDLTGELARWELACAPTTAWARLREGGRSEAFEEEVRHRDGRRLQFRVAPLPQGSRLVTLRDGGLVREWAAGEVEAPKRLAQGSEDRIGRLAS